MSTVVITGASGFLARYVGPCLSSAGAKVVTVSRRDVPGAVRVADYSSVPDGDVVIHLAEEPDRSKAMPHGDEDIRAAADVVTALTRQFNGRVVYASSAAVYGDAGQRPFRVGDPVQGIDAYSVSKLRNEAIVLNAGGSVARIANLIGRGMASTNVVSDILRQVPGEGPVTVRDVTGVRDYIAVEDGASAIRSMVTGAFTGIVNVGSGIGTSVLELIRLTLDVAKQSHRPVHATETPDRKSITVLDISETVKLLEWMPVIPLRDKMSSLLDARATA